MLCRSQLDAFAVLILLPESQSATMHHLARNSAANAIAFDTDGPRIGDHSEIENLFGASGANAGGSEYIDSYCPPEKYFRVFSKIFA